VGLDGKWKLQGRRLTAQDGVLAAVGGWTDRRWREASRRRRVAGRSGQKRKRRGARRTSVLMSWWSLGREGRTRPLGRSFFSSYSYLGWNEIPGWSMDHPSHPVDSPMQGGGILGHPGVSPCSRS
jgi:hypothetical protein